MHRKPMFLWGAALLLAAIPSSFSAIGKDVPAKSEKGVAAPVEKAPSKSLTTSKAKPEEKAGAKPMPELADKKSIDQTPSSELSADEKAILATGESFVKAYAAMDAKAAAAHFTADAEYIDEQGNVFRGRDSIEEVMKACFVANPGAEMELSIDSIRVISPGVALEDGATIVSRSDDSDPIYSRYSAVHVKTDGKWLSASVREHAPKDRRQHRTRLHQLAWLNGDWVDEGEDSVVLFSCQAVDGGNFLLRRFVTQISGQDAMSGTQRIGWDPVCGKLRAWTFDSEGGYTDGYWHRDDDRWILKSFGVTADGQTASSTSIYTYVDEQTMTWQSVDHEVAGVELPDSEVVTIVRRAPSPEAGEEVTLKTK